MALNKIDNIGGGSNILVFQANYTNGGYSSQYPFSKSKADILAIDLGKLEAINFTEFTQEADLSSGNWHNSTTFSIQSIIQNSGIITVTYNISVRGTGIWPASNSGTANIVIDVSGSDPIITTSMARIDAWYGGSAYDYYGEVDAAAPYILK